MKKISPETLKVLIDDYFKSCGKSILPDYAGMLLYLDIFPDEVNDLCGDGNKDAAKYRRIFEYAKLKRESWLNRLVVTDSRLASPAFNLLKQEQNGGYTSVSNTNKNSELRIRADGVGGMDAFK